MAGYEIKSIDKQILTQLIRIDMATRDISNQQQIIDNSNEVMDFLTTKYTSTDSYEHLENQERTLSYQLYTLAYGLAKRAEKASILKDHWKSTRLSSTLATGTPDTTGSCVQTRCLWDSEISKHQENRGYDFEVTKFVSLRLLAPLELVKMRELATCDISLPEILFDMDYPGHYCGGANWLLAPYGHSNCLLSIY
jgi:hypothetical protein